MVQRDWWEDGRQQFNGAAINEEKTEGGGEQTQTFFPLVRNGRWYIDRQRNIGWSIAGFEKQHYSSEIDVPG